MRCAMLAINSSVTISIAAKVPAMIANCTTRLRAGSMNCGRKAAKNRMPLGLVSADKAPWRNSDQPARGSGLRVQPDRRRAPDLDAQPHQVAPADPLQHREPDERSLQQGTDAEHRQ